MGVFPRYVICPQIVTEEPFFRHAGRRETPRRKFSRIRVTHDTFETPKSMKHLKLKTKTAAKLQGTALALMASCSFSTPAVAADEAMTDLLKTLRQRGSLSENEYERISGTAAKVVPVTTASLKDKWYERMSIRGYVQTRYTHVMGADPDAGPGLQLHSPTEPNISQRDSLLLRRGRMIFSGDIHPHLFLYAQIDYQAGVGGSYNQTNASGLQTRDLYGDVSFDVDKEHRLRIGISKVPYGWVNLQSSQNRLSIERPEALNSAVEGERDLGVYYIWANKEARQRFKDLVRLGLKGSGDYGVLSAGVYNGQTLNKLDSNRNLHAVVHAAYPFQLDSGQYFEVGASAYQGKIVVNPSSTASALKGIPQFTDRRVAANFIWYPQPFGIEAEWTYGEGPETVLDYDRATGKGKSRYGKITQEELHGGYLMANYKVDSESGVYIPFVRWSYFDGARKNKASTTASNSNQIVAQSGAPTQRVNEIDFGIEYQPWPSFEVTAVYTHAFHRSNTDTGYLVRDVDRVTLQLQFNY